jgi:pimeloyl-ACP methyl ester carboxylesterase
MPEKNISLKEIRAHVSYRKGNGKPVCFFHGGVESKATWDKVTEVLTVNNPTFAIDARGHGQSERSPSGSYDFPSMINDASEFLKFIGEELIIVGHSMGATAAFFAAAENPQLVSGICLEDNTPLFELDPAVSASSAVQSIKGIGAVAKQSVLKGEDAAELAAKIGDLGPPNRKMKDNFPSWYLEAWAAELIQLDPRFTETFFEHGPITNDLPAALKRLSCPIHLIYGEKGIVKDAHIERMQALYSNFSAELIVGARHNVHTFHAHEFVRGLESFIHICEGQ